jgi:hypothetical protein
MSRAGFAFSMVLVVTVAGWAYHVNYQTGEAQGRVDDLRRAIAVERQRLMVLEVEWAHLSRPDRLARLVAEHEGALALRALAPGQLGTAGAVPFPPKPPLAPRPVPVQPEPVPEAPMALVSAPVPPAQAVPGGVAVQGAALAEIDAQTAAPTVTMPLDAGGRAAPRVGPAPVARASAQRVAQADVSPPRVVRTPDAPSRPVETGVVAQSDLPPVQPLTQPVVAAARPPSALPTLAVEPVSWRQP